MPFQVSISWRNEPSVEVGQCGNCFYSNIELPGEYGKLPQVRFPENFLKSFKMIMVTNTKSPDPQMFEG